MLLIQGFTEEKVQHLMQAWSRVVFPQCLTGGRNGGVHCTDVSNASRTMLFNIHTMDWDPELCR